jgi:homoserine dehydrogenase
MIADRPGVLSALAHILGEKGISIASVIQHDSGDDDAEAESRPVPLVIMTHMAIEQNLRSALDEIDRLDIVRAPSVCLGVEE